MVGINGNPSELGLRPMLGTFSKPLMLMCSFVGLKAQTGAHLEFKRPPGSLRLNGRCQSGGPFMWTTCARIPHNPDQEGLKQETSRSARKL